MSIQITKGYKQLVREAEAEIETIPTKNAISLHGSPDVVIIDVRDVRERKREGYIPGSVSMPRGMLEFWVDPDSPYHREIFASGKRFMLYCSLGWRSALATQTLQRMGLTPVCHIEGGFTGWKEAGGPVEEL
jgi:rhodanese-related sulfurtransferase